MKMKIFLIFIILFECLVKYCALGQNDFCTLNSTITTQNLCEPTNPFVFVSESENDCRMAGSKCWCILIDNRNRDYGGNVVVELGHPINRDNLLPSGHNQYGEVKSYLQFEIVSGVNPIIVQPPGPNTNINSIKINSKDTCKFSNMNSQNNLKFQQSINSDTQFTPPDDDSYPNFADCLHRPNYTENSIKYCPIDRPEFMIEKRFSIYDQVYWCININNNNETLTSSNHLHIVYSSPNRRFVYYPSDTYIEREDTGSDFHLGNWRTTIAISQNNNQLVNLESITIDDQSICTYFDPQITRTSLYEPDTTTIQPQTELPETTERMKPRNDINPVENCGVKRGRNSLISHGNPTIPGDWPWHAAINEILPNGGTHYICGGTLVGVKTIVTAAHCILKSHKRLLAEELIVSLGRHDLSLATMATQEYNVYEVIPHGEYSTTTYKNDIAILVLSTYARLTKFVNLICLPPTNTNLENQIGTVVGWGLDQNNKKSNELKAAKFPVINYKKCLGSNRKFFQQYLTNTNFCTGFPNETNVCQGDSGGGLAFQSDDYNWFLGGVVSIAASLQSSERDCNLLEYSLFTDVTKFVSWINQNS